MTAQRKVEIVAAVIVLALAAVFLRGWVLEREARTSAEKQAAVDQQKIADAQVAIHDRDAVSARIDAALQQQAAAIKTPAQAVRIIQEHFTSPAGSTAAAPVEVSKADLPAAVQAKLPDAPGYAVLTDMQAADIARSQLSCDIARNDATTCKADLVDTQTQLTAAKDEARTWEAAAKGGTKWQRFGRVLKFVGCAGAGAAAGEFVDHSARAAAIGGAAAVAGCSLFKP